MSHLLLPAKYVGARQHFFTEGADGFAIATVQDVAPIFEQNKAMRNTNDGYSDTRGFRRVASVPHSLRDKWLQEEGWDAHRPDLYPEKLAEKFMDPDYAYLRTADGRVGVVGGVLK